MQNKKLEKLIAKSEELEKKIKENADKKAQLDKAIQQARAVEIMKFLSKKARKRYRKKKNHKRNLDFSEESETNTKKRKKACLN